MPISGRTPESLLPRSDSKNPATTCKGLTSNGRPCRRALAASHRASPTPSPSRGNGVLAILTQDDVAAFFCWQHKSQAEQLAAQEEQRTTLYPLKEKSSIDTLVDRVGVLDLEEEVPRTKRRHHRRKRSDEQRVTNRDTLPVGWHDMQSPLMTVPEEIVRPQTSQIPQHKYGRSNVKASWSCCIRAVDYDDLPPPRRQQNSRPHPRPQLGVEQYVPPPPMAYMPKAARYSVAEPSTRRKPVATQQSDPQVSQSSPPKLTLGPPTLPTRPTAQKTTSQTQTLLSLIPSHLCPQTTSALLSELSRPISPADESGYIYIFWLTPESELSKPDDETASSLLDDSDSDSDSDTETDPKSRTTEALRRYGSIRHISSTPQTITLKIGRATNIHRRLSQWSKQCGQNISLVRYYPYQRSSQSLNLNTLPKVPHVHRVERLIHLELSAQRVAKKECEQCGREHREWFEVEASRKGLRAVHETVRRWVMWAEGVDEIKENGGERTGVGVRGDSGGYY